MSSQKELTVIIPTKNENTYLTRLLDCLEIQSNQNFTIVIADFSDTNDVKSICDNRGVKCINGGLPGVGRNNGARYSSSKYLLFLDCDVLITDNFVQKALYYFELNKADCMSFGFMADSKNPILISLHFLVRNIFSFFTRLGIPHGIGGAILVKKEVHDSINGFDETVLIAEDHEYVKRVSRKFKYLFFTKLKVKLSVRRFQEEGIFRLSLKYLIIGLFRLFVGEIRTKIIPYFKDGY